MPDTVLELGERGENAAVGHLFTAAFSHAVVPRTRAPTCSVRVDGVLGGGLGCFVVLSITGLSYGRE